MSDGREHHCDGEFFCRDCGEMYCEHRSCSCFSCKCPCHGSETVIHDSAETH